MQRWGIICGERNREIFKGKSGKSTEVDMHKWWGRENRDWRETFRSKYDILITYLLVMFCLMHFETMAECSGHAIDSETKKSNNLINCCSRLSKQELCWRYSQTHKKQLQKGSIWEDMRKKCYNKSEKALSRAGRQWWNLCLREFLIALRTSLE